MTGFRKRWALGSSTSQSRNCSGSPRATARLVAMVVLPVPPLPLATLMITSKAFVSAPHHGFAALRTFHLQARNTALMGGFGPAGRADANIIHSCAWPPPGPPGPPAPLAASTTSAAARPWICSSTACSSWHGLIPSSIFIGGQAILCPKSCRYRRFPWQPGSQNSG